MISKKNPYNETASAQGTTIESKGEHEWGYCGRENSPTGTEGFFKLHLEESGEKSIGIPPFLVIINLRSTTWRRVTTSPSMASASPLVPWEMEESASWRINASGMYNVILADLVVKEMIIHAVNYRCLRE
ncbi:hypothetical protein AX14_008509 [Amanita brunnescens Koide BX004]|nr:hypothetical protein AX14_008509 [Amanita brunnescens Koide BX004]